MSYQHNGVAYSITSPIQSISINKLNIVVKDQNGAQRLRFTNVNESKRFLAWVYQG